MHDVAESLHELEQKHNQHMIINQTTKVKLITNFREKCISKAELSIAEVLREVQTYAGYVSDVPKKDYSTIKSYANPPRSVYIVAEGCCILLADYLKKK